MNATAPWWVVGDNPLGIPIGDRDRIEETIRYLLQTRWAEVSPMHINFGECENFAEAIQELTDLGDVIWLDDLPDYQDCCHAVLLHHDRYYDSEAPSGVDQLDDLPFIKRARHYAAMTAQWENSAANLVEVQC